MNWDAIGAIAELLGAIGVIASLIYLATQSRQNTETVRSAAVESAADRFAENNRVAALNLDLAELLESGHSDYEALSIVQKRRYRSFQIAVLRDHETIFLHHRNGLITDSHWEGFANSLRYQARRPGVQHVWQQTRLIFSPEFREFIDGVVEGELDA